MKPIQKKEGKTRTKIPLFWVLLLSVCLAVLHPRTKLHPPPLPSHTFPVPSFLPPPALSSSRHGERERGRKESSFVLSLSFGGTAFQCLPRRRRERREGGERDDDRSLQLQPPPAAADCSEILRAKKAESAILGEEIKKEKKITGVVIRSRSAFFFFFPVRARRYTSVE